MEEAAEKCALPAEKLISAGRADDANRITFLFPSVEAPAQGAALPGRDRGSHPSSRMSCAFALFRVIAPGVRKAVRQLLRRGTDEKRDRPEIGRDGGGVALLDQR